MVCRQEAASQIARAATPSIRGNPTAERADGNVCAVSSQDNVVKSENPAQINCQDKNAMKSVMRTIVKVVNYVKRNWVDTLKPNTFFLIVLPLIISTVPAVISLLNEEPCGKPQGINSHITNTTAVTLWQATGNSQVKSSDLPASCSFGLINFALGISFVVSHNNLSFHFPMPAFGGVDSF